MAVFQIEDGIATGRGFVGVDANGVCAKFRDWIVRAPAAGGPGWYIIDDYSANVFKNCAPANVNTTSEEITLTAHGFSHCHTVQFSTTTTAPGGLTNNSTYYVIYVNANTIKLANSFSNAVAGTAINLTSQGAGTHTITPMEYFIIISDTNAPAVNAYNSGPSGNAPKYMRIGYLVANAGYLQAHCLLYWDTSSRVGRGYFSGREITTYDAADFVYSFRGGAEQMMIATRTGTTWNYYILDDFVGDTNLLEAATKIGVLQSGISTGSNIVCQLAAGQALNFTLNNYYFMYDFSTDTKVNYFKVTAVDTINDTITAETINFAFPSGSVISPYAHRFYARGITRITSAGSLSVGTDETSSGSLGVYSRIPYFSSPNSTQCMRSQSSGNITAGYCQTDVLDAVLTRMAPDDAGFYAAQRPVLVETSNVAGTANRAYGILKNLYASTPGSALAWSDYRILSGRQWLFIGQNDFHTFSLNTESLV